MSSQDWSHYLSLGPQSWERIGDLSLRRHVGLRFMYRLLQCDPTAYHVSASYCLIVMLFPGD